jgi:hypothetical protein
MHWINGHCNDGGPGDDTQKWADDPNAPGGQQKNKANLDGGCQGIPDK